MVQSYQFHLQENFPFHSCSLCCLATDNTDNNREAARGGTERTCSIPIANRLAEWLYRNPFNFQYGTFYAETIKTSPLLNFSI